MKPKRIGTSNDWALDCGAASFDKLKDISGLRLVPPGTCSGSIDAMAVACTRLNLVMPLGNELDSANMPHNMPDLRDYQQAGVKAIYGMLKKYGGAILADDIGLGKTLQAVTVGRQLGGRKLIICPAYVREGWRDELLKWGEMNVAVLGPSTTKKHEAEWAKAPEAKWVVCSYELAERVEAAAFARRSPDLLIMDEGHYLCGRRTKRSTAIEAISTMSRYKLLLSATPMYSRPKDFYQPLRILFGKRFGTPSSFDFAYCNGSINQWGGMDNKGLSHQDELRQRLAFYMVRREKKDVLQDLPPLTRQVLWLEPSQEAAAAFHQAIGHQGGGVVSTALEATLEGKMEAAIELASQAKRFLLFTMRREHAQRMALTLNDRGTPCLCITGELTTEKRADICRQAQSEGVGIVATIDSLGAGVNLQGVASYGIMHGLDWVAAKMLQAEGRLHRMGQRDNVHWVYLAMKETMDAVVVRTVVQKMDHWRAVIGQADGREFRDALNDHIDGSGQQNQDVLKSIYDSLE